jgi:SAM-dependent methyltransferase
MPTVSAFHDWQLSLIDLQRVYSALDVGCGEGRMTQALRERSAPGAWIVALDLQPAVVAVTRATLAVDGIRAGIESLPLASGQFELATAGHVLPSTTNIPGAVRELRRILTPDGVLLASADSESSGRRLLDWHVEACRRAGLIDQASRAAAPSARGRFTLENGGRVLSRAFRTVHVHARDQALAFPSVDAVVRLYVNGLHLRGAEPLDDPEDAEALALRLQPHLRNVATAAAEPDGRVIVPRRSGCFVARAG